MDCRKWMLALVSLSFPLAPLFADSPKSAPPASLSERVIRVASLSAEDVQKAVDSAKDGDTILVPAGEATWKTPTPGTPALLIKEKALTLKGAGTGSTIIIDATGNAFGEDLIRIVGAPDKPVRVTGFTFKGMLAGGSANSALTVVGSCNSWRVDHCTFDATGGRGLFVFDSSFGLIDNCAFTSCREGVHIQGKGPDSWKEPLALGSDKAVYIENCFFDHSSSSGDAALISNGARMVFRSNRVLNADVCGSSCGIGGRRAGFSFEIYGNTMTCTKTGGKPYALHLGGGTGVIFSNTFTNYSQAISIYNSRSSDEIGMTQCQPFGICNGKNSLDGNKDSSGYPALDQIGRSTNQSFQPLYEWTNSLNGRVAGVSVDTLNSLRSSQHLQAGRDFFNNTPRPGYKPLPFPHPLAKADKTPPKK